tara:strand:+ start:4143 stop:4427 length:285 start_codon:yes stop_codon:yes gene_type:complete
MLLAVLPAVKKILDNKKKEGFVQPNAAEGVIGAVWGIVNVLVGIYALYLSFHRNQGFDLGSLLAACCCSWCYVAYALAVPVAPRINTRNQFTFK